MVIQTTSILHKSGSTKLTSRGFLSANSTFHKFLNPYLTLVRVRAYYNQHGSSSDAASLTDRNITPIDLYLILNGKREKKFRRLLFQKETLLAIWCWKEILESFRNTMHSQVAHAKKDVLVCCLVN
ncbi:unnamed protein product [Albugo candida]|uniref:Uncharacterized protein n=1 Tax=Albugo candida TaxID=65357 RepID=A0A024G3H5_9STRA|nr:unnamed protein product [Albugo candida]|eukprot:CCI41373.1 unnamed protein product [Albugo candida]